MNDTLFGRRIGERILICPECASHSVIVDAGPGRCFCSGQGGYDHPELEMVPYVREDAGRERRGPLAFENPRHP